MIRGRSEGLVRSYYPVIPAQAGIHILDGSESMDPRLRGDDSKMGYSSSGGLVGAGEDGGAAGAGGVMPPGRMSGCAVQGERM